MRNPSAWCQRQQGLKLGMTLDFQTLVVAVAVTAVFCAAARILLWRMHPGVPGLGHWSVAGILSALALMSYSLLRPFPQLQVVPLPPTIAALALVVGWDGFRRFFGRPPLSRAALAALAVATVVPTTIVYQQGWVEARVLINSLLLGALSAAVGRELLRPQEWSGPVTRITAYFYLATTVFMALRMAATLRDDAGAVNGPFPSAVLLWWLASSVAVTLGMALMTGERLQWDLDRQASQDPLTGALNRRAFATLAEREVARARRSGQPLSVLAMDLDHFKAINDQFGHAVGDETLCRFVTVAGHQLRSNDILCRFGGEEFIALLPETTCDAAWAAAERLRVAFSNCSAGPAGPGLAVSMGIAELHPDEDIETTLRRADTALYQAKAEGRNRCVLADIPTRQAALRQSL